MDTLIIEHLACLEINRLILQPPYRLVSEIQFNDKSPCFDGEVIIYNSSKLTKTNILDIVKVQIKGTSKYKNIKSNKVRHEIYKNDLLTFKNVGKGCLYFLVVVNEKTKKCKAFYKSLTPLEIERLLNEIDEKSQLKETEQQSLTIDFKAIKEGELEQICISQMKRVNKQPSHFIEMSKRKNFEKFKLEYDIMPSEIKDFDPLKTPINIYGIEGDMEFPIEARIPNALNIKSREQFNFLNESIEFEFEIIDSIESIAIFIESTLEVKIDKIKKKVELNILRLKTLNSYLKSLKVLKYINQESRFPLKIYNIQIAIDNLDELIDIDRAIEVHQNLLSIFSRIGISGDYEFPEEENLEELFNNIEDIFRNKNYSRIIGSDDLDSQLILPIRLSKYINLLLFKNKDGFYYDLFNRDILSNLCGFVSKDKKQYESYTEDNYYKVSIFSGHELKELISYTNFKFEIYEETFKSDMHTKEIEQNNHIALQLINLFDTEKQEKYLKLAKYLLEELVLKNNKDLYKLNILQIKKRQQQLFSNEEEIFLSDLIESDNELMKYGAYVILGLKQSAQRIFDDLSPEIKREIEKYPIYYLHSSI